MICNVKPSSVRVGAPNVGVKVGRMLDGVDEPPHATSKWMTNKVEKIRNIRRIVRHLDKL